MNLVFHADRILSAWQSLDLARLAAELDRAGRFLASFTPLSPIAFEHAEVFAAVTGRLRSLIQCEATPATHQLEASLNLLRHLRDRAATSFTPSPIAVAA